MACSKEVIERKRQLALLKINGRQNKGKPINRMITGTVYLISSDRFEVNVTEFSDTLIRIFKTIPSKLYDCDKRMWSFSLKHYDDFQIKVMQLRPDIVIGVIPQFVLNVMRTPNNEENVDISRIDETLSQKLLPFQVQGVKFGILKKGRCMIADDMGLGKTFQALAIANYYVENWPLLIVTTSTMRETWENKIHELLPSIPMASVVCISTGKEKQYLTDTIFKIVIISYKMCTICTDELINKKFGAVILDESHLLKSYKALHTNTIMKITKNSKRIILLTGTPALSRPCELFTQLQIIEPKFFNGYIEFGKRYCNGKQTSFGWDMSGQSNLAELQILLQIKFLIRRTKEQVLSCLKNKTRESVILDSSLLNLNEKSKEGLSQLAFSYSNKKSADKHAALLAFFSESAKVKIPAVCQYVSNLVKEKKKFLVFAHHLNVLNAICHTLDECRVHYIHIDGTTKTSHRSVLVDKFQFNVSCQCAVLSITAANAGITLTAAELVIFAELHWNPGILVQAESRAHRIGQENGVYVKYLLAKGTSDDFMWPMLEKKLQILNQVGLSDDTFKNATLVSQPSSSCIDKYLNISQKKFIPGTNISINTENDVMNDIQMAESTNTESLLLEETFFADKEGDEFLANIEF